MRITFTVGELVAVHPNYESGLWLRNKINLSTISAETGHIPGNSLMTILEVIGENVKVVGLGGRIGWTWKNRLRKIQ